MKKRIDSKTSRPCFYGRLHAMSQRGFFSYFWKEHHRLSLVQESVQHGTSQRAVVVEDFGPVFIGLFFNGEHNLPNYSERRR